MQSTEPSYTEEPSLSGLTDLEKKEHYARMFRGVPDALFILSGRVRNIGTTEEPEYVSTGYDYSDGFGVLAGIARVDAAAEVSRYFSETKIVTTSYTPGPGTTQLIIDANVMAKELKRSGVTEDHIIREVSSTNTLTELQEMVKLIAKYRWRHIGIITSEFHAERVAEMLSHLQDLSNVQDEALQESLVYVGCMSPLVVVVKAEDILIPVSSHYRYLIEHARTQPSYKERLESERRGIEAIKNGSYRPTGKTSRLKTVEPMTLQKDDKPT